tara:strand:+ start:258 stop:368 length:111 start_codon:yes stop_codon:yes gene_type:complete
MAGGAAPGKNFPAFISWNEIYNDETENQNYARIFNN